MTHFPNRLAPRFRGWCLCLCICLMAGCAASGPSLVENGPQAAPYTRLTLLDGRYVPLQEFAGRPLILMFWSTTCRASRKEIVRLDALAAQRSDRIRVVAVSLDRDLQALQDAIQGLGLRHVMHAFSGNEAADEAYLAFQQRDVPQLFLIDAGGIIRAHAQTVSNIEDRLDELL